MVFFLFSKAAESFSESTKECPGSRHLWSMHDNLLSHADCFFVVEHGFGARNLLQTLVSYHHFMCTYHSFLYYTASYVVIT